MEIWSQEFLFKLSLKTEKKEMPGYASFCYKQTSKVKVDSDFFLCKREKRKSTFTS